MDKRVGVSNLSLVLLDFSTPQFNKQASTSTFQSLSPCFFPPFLFILSLPNPLIFLSSKIVSCCYSPAPFTLIAGSPTMLTAWDRSHLQAQPFPFCSLSSLIAYTSHCLAFFAARVPFCEMNCQHSCKHTDYSLLPYPDSPLLTLPYSQ